MYLNISNLNVTETYIHSKLPLIVKEEPSITINKAAELCGVSTSKISKYVQKLDFNNFKQYKRYFSGEDFVSSTQTQSSELERIKQYIEGFDPILVEKFINEIDKYEKIIFFGLGPSFMCVEYFAYKMNYVSHKKILVFQDEHMAQHLADANTLVLIFSVTGVFSNFENFIKNIKEKKAHSILVLEEYNTEVGKEIDNVFYLTKATQNNRLEPYQKTRTVFFIFIEEVISQLIERNKSVGLQKNDKQG